MEPRISSLLEISHKFNMVTRNTKWFIYIYDMIGLIRGEIVNTHTSVSFNIANIIPKQSKCDIRELSVQ